MTSAALAAGAGGFCDNARPYPRHTTKTIMKLNSLRLEASRRPLPGHFRSSMVEPKTASAFPQLAAGLASESKIESPLEVEDSLRVAAGSFNADRLPKKSFPAAYRPLPLFESILTHSAGARTYLFWSLSRGFVLGIIILSETTMSENGVKSVFFEKKGFFLFPHQS